jgi:hypothetical protein
MTSARGRALLVALLGALALLVPVALALPVSAAQPRTFVVQALAGGPVDVSVAGQRLTGLAPGTVREATSLPPGTHAVEVRRAGAVLVSERVNVLDGVSTSIVVHAASTPEGPRVAVGLSDAPADQPSAGQGRMAVLYVGASGPIDVRVDGVRAGPLSSLDTGGGAQGDMVPGDHDVAVARAGSGTVLLPTQRVSLAAGATTYVYLFGGLEGGPLSLTTQVFGPASNASAPGGGGSRGPGTAPDAGPTLRAGDGAPAGDAVPGTTPGAGGAGPGAGAGGPGSVPAGTADFPPDPLGASGAAKGAHPVTMKGGRSGVGEGAREVGDGTPGDDALTAAAGEPAGGIPAPAWPALLLLAAAGAATGETLRRRRRADPAAPAAP